MPLTCKEHSVRQEHLFAKYPYYCGAPIIGICCIMLGIEGPSPSGIPSGPCEAGGHGMPPSGPCIIGGYGHGPPAGQLPGYPMP
mmetsp:Transcript_89438/g.253413  ORF Transcript_89438/g.253413 Transcript_89438/m.253413 type:complete len:84 (-) Transcript_89438:1935-2186(-)